MNLNSASKSVRWSAAMMSPVDDFAGAPLVRREASVNVGPGEVVSAVLHVSGLGVFEAFVDSVPGADDVLSPGWSSYEWRLRYRSYDVTALLHTTFVVGVSLATGGTAAGRAGLAAGHCMAIGWG